MSYNSPSHVWKGILGLDVCGCSICQGGRLGTLVSGQVPPNSTNVMKDRIMYPCHIILLAMFGREF